MTTPINFNAARAQKHNDNGLLSPIDLLEDMARHLREQAAADPSAKLPNAAIVILLTSDDDGLYFVRTDRSNLRNSECIALVEVAKARWVKPLAGED